MPKIDSMQLENALKGIQYPVSKEQLIQHLIQHNANEQIRQAARQLPEQQFRSVNDVTRAFESVNVR